MLKSDFHLHTKEDKEDFVGYSAKELIDRAAELGYEVLAITHHDNVHYNKELSNYARSKGILLIPGIEKTIEGSHVVILNTKNEYVQNINSFSDLKKFKEKNQKSLIFAPHPYIPFLKSLSKKLEKNIDCFDAIEYSTFYTALINFNNKSVSISDKYKKPLIGTSDSHNLFQLNTTYSLVYSKKDIDSIIDAIKKGKISVKTRRLSFFNFLRIIAYSLKQKALFLIYRNVYK